MYNYLYQVPELILRELSRFNANIKFCILVMKQTYEGVWAGIVLSVAY